MEKIRGTWYVLKWQDFPLCRGSGEIVATGFTEEIQAKHSIHPSWMFGETFNDETGNHYQTRYYPTVHEQAVAYATDESSVTLTFNDLCELQSYPKKLTQLIADSKKAYDKAYEKAVGMTT